MPMSIWKDLVALWKNKPADDERLNISIGQFITAIVVYVLMVFLLIGMIWSCCDDWTVALGITIPLGVIAWVAAQASVGSMPSNSFGQRSFFGRRYGRSLYEGLYLKFPGSKVSELTLKPYPVKVPYQIASSDNLKLTGEALITVRNDPMIRDGYDRIV